MEKTEYRAVIKFLHLKGKKTQEIKDELDSVYGEASPSFTTVKHWVAEYKRGRTSILDEERSGRPKTATTDEMVDLVHRTVMEDRRLTVKDIAEACGISSERVHKILHQDLDMRKLSARWVPRLLTIDQKRVRADMSRECLSLYQKNPAEFLRRTITVDETWVHHHTPETKQQSMQWIAVGEPAPKKAKVVLSAGKVMATVFWDSRGIILIDYLAKGKTINGQYYAALLDKLKATIKKKRPHLAKKKILFHQDNARVHTCMVAMSKLNELKFELLPHPPYSPDLAPSDFFLFPNLKKFLGGKKYGSNAEVEDAVNQYFSGLDNQFFSDGLKGWEKRWTKCIELQGDYVEK
jgi:histone-lysine N-methyltransferase SETMAR